MADEAFRKLMIEMRRGLVTIVQGIDQYLAETSKRPERARRVYGPDGDSGYIAEVKPRTK